MKASETKFETLKDLRDFLNNQPEEFLDKPPYILIGDNEMADRINAAGVFDENHINPSGESWEPVSVYADSEEPEDRELAETESVCGRKGDIFFIGGWAELGQIEKVEKNPNLD